MKVVWSDEARVDLARLVKFVKPKNPHAARAIAGRLYEAGESLCDLPLRFRTGALPGTRERPVDDYVIVYIVSPDTIRILRIWHGREERQSEEASEDQTA
ncbi:MAG: type II toxin-antitoxin system RelE/ParE family toxin [Magnetospirillum sp.]|nr:type II toxin-antitoxin system RelE/ParE family toxin [Magnetospirillum sp.]